MNGLRFKVGDLVRFLVPRFNPEQTGQIREVVCVGPFRKGQIVMGSKMCNDNDYVITSPYHLNGRGGAKDWQLQPINPLKEPASLTREKDVEC